MNSNTGKTDITSAVSTPSPSPSGPSLIIFYRRREDVHGIPGVFFLGTSDQRVSLLKAFDTKAIHVLLVPINHCTGWRTQLTRSDCRILFAGGPYKPEDVNQALARVRTLIPDKSVSLQPAHSVY
jgi:hypothetical protein